MTAALKILGSLGKGLGICGVWFAAVVVDETTLVPLGSAIAVLLAVWHLSARLQRMEDGIKEMNRRIKALEE